MSNWACPNCAAPCGDAKILVEHLISSYLLEQTSEHSVSYKRKKRLLVTEDKEINLQAGNKVDYICPYPHCGHQKKYSSKSNLLRHFSTHHTVVEDPDLQCPRCLKSKENLGALSAHWEKSCKRKIGPHHRNNKNDQLRLDILNKKKAEMGMRLTLALNAKVIAVREQAGRGRRAVSAGFSCGSPIDTPDTSSGRAAQTEHTEPPADYSMPRSDAALALVSPVRSGMRDSISTFEPTGLCSSYVARGCDSSIADREGWTTQGYDNELVKESNWYTDADLEAWLYDFS